VVFLSPADTLRDGICLRVCGANEKKWARSRSTGPSLAPLSWRSYFTLWDIVNSLGGQTAVEFLIAAAGSLFYRRYKSNSVVRRYREARSLFCL